MILSINPGSSSLKYKLFNDELNIVKKNNFEVPEDSIEFDSVLDQMIDEIESNFSDIEKIVIRVVHGGPNHKEIASVNEEVLKEIERYSPLAPLHNPEALEVIKKISEKFDQSKIFAAFDTGYFNYLPPEASNYAIGKTETPLIIKRYGFHGISHKYMQEMTDSQNEKKVITIHLGSGCSISAINKGKVIATSMGLTPDGGLIMQTRSGDLDPGLILFLVSKIGLEETKELIEKKSGLAGLTGTSGDMINVLLLAGEEVTGVDSNLEIEKTDENISKAKLALNMYVNKIVQYIGAYSALMGGVNVIVFSGKIGENSKVIREKVMSRLEYLGNIETKVVKTDEELAMARLVQK